MWLYWYHRQKILRLLKIKFYLDLKNVFSFSESLKLKELNSQAFGDFFKHHQNFIPDNHRRSDSLFYCEYLQSGKRWKEYTEELYKKDLHDPDNHDGVITDLEPDILECEVKWALGSITMNKASGVIEFQLSYCKSWKMMLWKCCTQYVNRTGKGQFSLQSQRKEMPKSWKAPPWGRGGKVGEGCWDWA